jgi:NAD/NADP transhydrogenase beta subunit
MPVVDADKAKTAYAIKRSKKPGFAGIGQRALFSRQNLHALGNAKGVVGELAGEGGH